MGEGEGWHFHFCFLKTLRETLCDILDFNLYSNYL